MTRASTLSTIRRRRGMARRDQFESSYRQGFSETGAETRLDAADIGAFQRQLEDIEQEVQYIEHEALPFASGVLVPIEVENKPWANTVTYRQVDRIGHFAMIRSYATDIPLVSTISREFTQRVHRFAIAAFYMDDEIAAAVHLGQNISQEQIDTCTEASEQELNSLIAFGRSTDGTRTGFSGFLNHPDMLRTYSPFAFNATSDPDEILAVMDDSATAIVKQTGQVEKPDTMLLPPDAYHYVTRTRLSANLNDTILRQFLAETPYIKDVFMVNELQGAGPNGSDILMTYKRDPKRCKARVKQPLTWNNWERENLGYKRIASFKFGGLAVYRPYAHHIVAGI